MIFSVALLCLTSCSVKQSNPLDIDKELLYCNTQIQRTLSEIGNSAQMPRNIADTASQ
jgi:unsaturated chondroitin disaccharide hydrolase